jgi:uncharacterized protein DUF6249
LFHPTAVKQFKERASLICSNESLGGAVDDFYMISPFLIPITAIVGVFAYIIIKTLARTRVRELEIRERIAMIERGLVPPPEVDPRGFDHAMDRVERIRDFRRGAGRHRRAGVTLMGVGFGLMVLIAFTSNETSVAIGVGGFLVVMGIAFFINSLMESTVESPYVAGPRSFGATSSTPAPPAEPPRRE